MRVTTPWHDAGRTRTAPVRRAPERWLAVLLAILAVCRADPGRAAENNRGACGDQGDGTYANPILPGDFSDPDVIRVGDDYYLLASSFQYAPGGVVMQSKDLVNWRYLSRCVPDLTQIGPELNWNRMNRHGRGSGRVRSAGMTANSGCTSRPSTKESS